MSRLTALNIYPSATGNSYGLSYSPSGQITQRTSSNDAFDYVVPANVSRGYTSNGLNQYTAIGGLSPNPTYDPRGNLTSAGSTTYSYSVENELALAGTTRFYYDAFRRMVDIAQSTLRMDYDGSNLITEYDNSGNLLRRYVFGPGTDEPIVWYEGSGTSDRRYLAADERGSVVTITNTSGPLATNRYDEYGVPASSNQGRFQYTGQAWIAELGMYNYKARIYSPTLGRFLQTDPVGYGAGQNLYHYVGADPINASDPSGLQCTGSLSDAGCDPSTGLAYGASGSSAGDGGGYLTEIKYKGDPTWHFLSYLPNSLVYGSSFQAGETSGLAGTAASSLQNGSPVGGEILVNGTRVHGIWTYGNFSGPGGMGTPVNSVDAACMRHDKAFGESGADYTSMQNETAWGRLKPSQQRAVNAPIRHYATRCLIYIRIYLLGM